MTVFDYTGPLAWTPMSTRKQKKGADPSQFDFLVGLFLIIVHQFYNYSSNYYSLFYNFFYLCKKFDYDKEAQ